MENLPVDSLIEIALRLPIEKVEDMCLASHILDAKLCQNEDFWQNRYLQDFGQPTYIPLVWKEAYYRNIHTKVYAIHDVGESNFYNIENLGTQNIRKILVRKNMSLFLDYFGQLTGWKSQHNKINGLGSIKDISAGNNHGLALTKSGEVYSFGSNNNGQLGLGDNLDRWNPTLIPNLPKITAISAGGQYSLVLSEDGVLYGFGSNSEGELGLGDLRDRYEPEIISNNISTMSAGTTHSLMVDLDGKVFVFGGQNGIPGRYDKLVPFQIQEIPKAQAVSASGEVSLILTLGRHIIIFGRHTNFSITHSIFSGFPSRGRVLDVSNIISICAGQDYSLALNGNGEVYMIKDRDSDKDEIILINEISNGLDTFIGKPSFVLTGRLTPRSTIESMIDRELIQSYHPKYSRGDNWVFEFTDILGDTYLSEF